MPQSEGLLMTSLPEGLLPCHANTQRAKQHSLSHGLWFTERREIQAFKPEFAESRFSMKEVILHGPSPQPGAWGSQPTHTATSQQHQHAPQGPAYITIPLLRALPALEKAGNEAKAHGQAVVFSFQPPETSACTFSSLLIENAENCRAWLAWDPIPDISDKSTHAFVDPKSRAKRWKFISFSNAEVTNHVTPMRELWLESQVELPVIVHIWGYKPLKVVKYIRKPLNKY